MTDQYKMERQQRVSFTAEEAERINAALDIMKDCTGKDVSVNRLIKAAAVARAKSINNGEEKGE